MRPWRYNSLRVRVRITIMSHVTASLYSTMYILWSKPTSRKLCWWELNGPKVIKDPREQHRNPSEPVEDWISSQLYECVSSFDPAAAAVSNQFGWEPTRVFTRSSVIKNVCTGMMTYHSLLSGVNNGSRENQVKPDRIVYLLSSATLEMMVWKFQSR